MQTELLKLLNQNARYTVSELAAMLGTDEKTVESKMSELEKAGIIRGYKTIIDWEQLDVAYVSAIIELNVIPKADLGFEDIAERIASFSQVESVYLMSGSYDLNVVVRGKTLQDVAKFVARELATLDSVTSTATHFVMRRYKEMDLCLYDSEKDDRGQYLL